MGGAAHARTGREIDGHGCPRGRIAGKVNAAATDQRVGAKSARERVRTRPAIDQVVAGVAQQAVRLTRANDVLDVGEMVSGSITAGRAASRQADRDGGRARIVKGIDADAAIKAVGARPARKRVVGGFAIQRVGADPACQTIVAGATVQQVGIVVTRQPVIGPRAGDVGDARQDIALRVAAGTRPGRQVDRDGTARGRIGCGVGAAPTLERVATGQTGEHVVACSAIDDIGIAIAGQPVVAGRSDQIGDPDQDVAGRCPAAAGAAREADGDGRQRGGVDRRVISTTAHQGVGPKAAHKKIVAPTAVQQVVVAITRQGVRKSGADDIADRREHVAFGVAAPLGGRSEIHVDCQARERIVGRIGSAAANESVGEAAADEGVRSGTAVQQVGRPVTRDQVGIAGPRDLADPHIDVALGITTGPAGREVHGHGSRPRIVDEIRAAAALERVGPGAAHEGVVAAAAVQHIVAGASGQAVVPAGADDVLDVCKRIAGGVAARCSSRSEIDGDCGRTGVVERVVARSAINAVGASAARKDVVVVAAHERVGAAATAQRIGTVAAKEQVGVAVSGDAVGKDGAAHIRNIGQDVALGIAAGTVPCE